MPELLQEDTSVTFVVDQMRREEMSKYKITRRKFVAGITNVAEAIQYLQREYRKGWSL